MQRTQPFNISPSWGDNILQQVHGKSLLITENTTHKIRKTSKPDNGQLLRYDLLFVPHSRIILGRVIKGLLHEVGTDISKMLPTFLYLIISPNYLYPASWGERLIQFKMPSRFSKGTIW